MLVTKIRPSGPGIGVSENLRGRLARKHNEPASAKPDKRLSPRLCPYFVEDNRDAAAAHGIVEAAVAEAVSVPCRRQQGCSRPAWHLRSGCRRGCVRTLSKTTGMQPPRMAS
eukprot:457591-Prorocentrum_minimum.AAC.1